MISKKIIIVGTPVFTALTAVALAMYFKIDIIPIPLVFAVVSSIVVLVLSIIDEFRPYWYDKVCDFMNKSVELKVWLLVVVIFIVAIVFIVYISQNNNELNANTELECIFPQIAKIPYVTNGTYGSSGRTISNFKVDNLDGMECYTEIIFQNSNMSYTSSGWMIFPLRSYDASRYTHLSFKVKGKDGGEKFGIKIKDMQNVEVGFEVMQYVDSKKISTNWQEVVIPLSKFYPAYKESIEVISLYSDDTMLKDGEETIYVSKFKLY